MSESYPAGQALVLYPEFVNYEGEAIVPVSSTYSLYDRDGTALATDQTVDLFSAEQPQLTISAALNTLPVDEARGYRRVELTTQDENGLTFQSTITYFLKTDAGLIKGINSFATLPDLQLLALDMIHLRTFQNATAERQISALIQAWNNLGQLPVRLVDLEGTDKANLGSTRELVDTDIDLLQPKTYQRLMRAQIIEADDVLGGNPIETRRRLGLISDSAGESAHFFRTSKPLDLPCCRAAIDELRGIVNWSKRVGRT